MPATIMDGRALAAKVQAEVAGDVAGLGDVGLATVLVGDDPASHIYIRRKHEAAQGVGIRSDDRRLPADISQEELIAIVEELNDDDSIDGILVQSPLPKHLDEAKTIEALDPAKAVSLRKHVGGAAPKEMTRMLASRRETLADHLGWVEERHAAIKAARQETAALIQQLDR